MADILIYGAYGYTGRLIVQEALSYNLKPVLSGRNKEALKEMAAITGLGYEVLTLRDTESLENALKPISVVIHCAGPFQHTAEQMVKACLNTKTHYLDITGEHKVFEWIHQQDALAKHNGVMLLPGSGFDVVPSDCLAANLKHTLPSATKLEMAFSSAAGLSRGTAKTMVEGLGEGQVFRISHQLSSRPLAMKTKKINYCGKEKLSVGISWGDVASAYYSTGIPNIEIFTAIAKKQLKQLRWIRRFKLLFSINIVKEFLKKQIDKKVIGPSQEKRDQAGAVLWGKVQDENGKSVEMCLSTLNGYSLTAKATVLFVRKILKGDFKPGYQTPSTAYGKDVILELGKSEFILL